VKKVVIGTVALSAAVLFALPGCSADGQGATKPAAPQPADPKLALASAVKKTDSQGSARLTMKATVAGEKVTMKGVLKFSTPPVGRFEVTQADKGKPAEEVELLLLRDAMYMKMDTLAAQTGKTWMRMRYADLAKAAGSGAGKALQENLSQNQDPRQFLKLTLASEDLKEVGKETVGGVETRHFRGTIDSSEALAKNNQITGLPASDRAALKKRFAQLKLDKMKADVWVDGDGWPRRLTVKAGSGASRMVVTEEFSDFGTPVNVTAPPSGEVQDFGELLKMIQNATAGQS
jgi:hypothetical protein